MTSNICNTIFDACVLDYHRKDDVDASMQSPYPASSFEHLLYHKTWIDTVQWHLEDIVRNPTIDPMEGIAIKRRIDRSNQDRTDMVENIDAYFLDIYKSIQSRTGATINTESPAWAIDRLSILTLKIYHMQAEANRKDASAEHVKACTDKVVILLEQRKDLSQAIDDLLNDIANGDKYMKVYKQMKMYNDPSLNPVLYQQSGN